MPFDQFNFHAVAATILFFFFFNIMHLWHFPFLDLHSEIFPYLVIVVGVENILVITKSVVSTPVDLEVKIRVAQGIEPCSQCKTLHPRFYDRFNTFLNLKFLVKDHERFKMQNMWSQSRNNYFTINIFLVRKMEIRKNLSFQWGIKLQTFGIQWSQLQRLFQSFYLTCNLQWYCQDWQSKKLFCEWKET